MNLNVIRVSKHKAILSHCGAVPVKSVGSHNQIETKFNLRELLLHDSQLSPVLCRWCCVGRNPTLQYVYEKCHIVLM